MNKLLLFTFFFVFFQTAFTQNFDFVDDDKGGSHDMITVIDAGIKKPLHAVKINDSSIPIYLTYYNTALINMNFEYCRVIL